ncbi:MAG: sulfurtransferase [Magnetococcales bacterium]|nr:sulfurtransferase [Magnetococcales bacterium]
MTNHFFVDGEWLQSRLNTAVVRIIQVGGENQYVSMHVPGAVLVSYAQFTTPRDGVPGMRGDVAVLAGLFGRLGIGPETTVVAYDLSGGTDASRLVWTLVSMGHKGGAAVLDGGLAVWLQEGRPVESVPTVIAAGVEFIAQPDDSWEANLEQVLAVTEGGTETVLLDTRTRNEYVGMTLRSPRGHLRGAVHLDWVETLVGRQDPRLQPLDSLRARLAAIGVSDPAREVIVYCETAHRAAQTWVLLRHLGWQKVRLYDGSIAEWRVYDLPVVSGENPG